jgi:3-phenylpropionate/cinnamic acid dioxygenase small subunit
MARAPRSGGRVSAAHVDDDLAALEMRVQRLESGYAWAEEPPSRVRRFVTNLRVEAREGETEVEASVNLLVSRTRGEDPTADLFAGERRDVLRKTATGWKLVSRLVLLDQAVLAGHFPTIL